MDFPKQLQCLVKQTQRLFGEHILLGQYYPGQKFDCQRFIAHSFHLMMLGA